MDPTAGVDGPLDRAELRTKDNVQLLDVDLVSL
jgi:hypothetical protein